MVRVRALYPQPSRSAWQSIGDGARATLAPIFSDGIEFWHCRNFRRSELAKFEADIESDATDRPLFLAMNYCRFRLSLVMKQLRGGPIGFEACRMLLVWAERAESLRKTLVSRHVGLCYRLARNQPNYDDAVADGLLRLFRIVDLFDVTRGFAFSTYACFAIRQGLYRAANREQRRPMMESESRASALAATPPRTPERDAMSAELRRVVEDESSGLTEIERQVIRRRYGLWMHRPDTLEGVGRALGITAERTRQVELSAIGKLRACYQVENVPEVAKPARSRPKARSNYPRKK